MDPLRPVRRGSGPSPRRRGEVVRPLWGGDSVRLPGIARDKDLHLVSSWDSPDEPYEVHRLHASRVCAVGVGADIRRDIFWATNWSRRSVPTCTTSTTWSRRSFSPGLSICFCAGDPPVHLEPERRGASRGASRRAYWRGGGLLAGWWAWASDPGWANPLR